MKPKTNHKHVGIELEVIVPVRVAKLRRELNKLKLKNIQVGHDGSVHGSERACGCGRCEIVTPVEIRLLATQRQICKDLAATMVKLRELGAWTNNTCGLHVHLDARNVSHKQMYSKLVKALPRLNRMVKCNRLRNQYCRPNQSDDWDNNEVFNEFGDRQAINQRAYAEHGTIEVRLHEATLNIAKAVRWVKTLTRIAY